MSLTLVTCTVPVVFELVSETTLISGEAAAFAENPLYDAEKMGSAVDHANGVTRSRVPASTLN